MSGPWEKYQKKSTNQPIGDGPWNRYKKAQETAATTSELADGAKSGLSTALDTVGRVVGYPAGLARTAVADIYDQTQDGNKVTSDDWKKALGGHATPSDEFYKRFGVPEGPSVDLNPLAKGKTSARDALGFATDVVLDPLTVASLGADTIAEKLPQAGKALDYGVNPASKLLELMGNKAYRSGFKKIDESLIEKGMKPLSEVMLENGRPAGTVAKLSNEADRIAAEKMAQRNQIYQQINNSGQKVGVLDAMTPALEKGQEILRKAPGADDQVALMNDWLMKYGKEGDHVPVDLASDWKSNLYNSMPANAYNPTGRMLPAPKQIQQQFARGLKEGIEQAGERTEPGLGSKVGSINEDLGSIIQSQKPMAREIRKGNSVNAITPVDAAILTVNSPVAAAKKLADIGKTTWARTNAGKALMATGEKDITDPILRQLLERQNTEDSQPFSRWNLLGN